MLWSQVCVFWVYFQKWHIITHSLLLYNVQLILASPILKLTKQHSLNYQVKVSMIFLCGWYKEDTNNQSIELTNIYTGWSLWPDSCMCVSEKGQTLKRDAVLPSFYWRFCLPHSRVWGDVAEQYGEKCRTFALKLFAITFMQKNYLVSLKFLCSFRIYPMPWMLQKSQINWDYTRYAKEHGTFRQHVLPAVMAFMRVLSG